MTSGCSCAAAAGLGTAGEAKAKGRTVIAADNKRFSIVLDQLV